MPAQPAATAQRFQYDPSKPVEDQLHTFLAGRNPFGTMGNYDWQNTGNSKYFSATMGSPDEGGNTMPVIQSLDPRVQYHQGADSNFVIDGQFAPINWRDTTNPNGIAMPNPGTSSSDWGGATPPGTTLQKPDDMYDYNNIYYDPTYGLVRDARDYRDPNAKQNGYLDAGIMAAVGGLGGLAAGAANAAAGGYSFLGQGLPSIARTGINLISSAAGSRDAGQPNPQAASPNALNRTNYGGTNVAAPNTNGVPYTGSPFGGLTGAPATLAGAALKDTPASTDPNAASTGGATNDGSGNGDLFGVLGNLLTAGATGYGINQINQGYRSDINNMMSIGTGGLQNSDRAGAQALVRGVYDGSISPDQVLSRVPGLQALSDRGAADIGRQMSAHGDADPQSSARMREFINFNNDLTSKAYGSEMDRAMKVAGYNIDPSAMAGQGMRAVGEIYGNNRQDLSGLAALAGRGAGGTGAGGAIGNLLRQIATGGGNSAGGGLAGLAKGLFSGSSDPGSGIDWSSTNGYYEPGTVGYITDQTDPFINSDPTQGMNLNPPMPDLNEFDPNYYQPYFDPSTWGMS